jgi:NADH:ubiquinone oxidoreductase subunit 6 (subunit J)
MTVTSSSGFVSLLFLVRCFRLSALYVVSQGLAFIRLAYLVIYIRAIAVLFLFVSLLIGEPRKIERMPTNKSSAVGLILRTLRL